MRTRFVTAQRTGTAVWAPMRTLKGGRARANAVAAHAAVSAMPRTVSSKIRVALPARETWRLRCDFALEQHIASLNRRKLHFLEEEVIREGAEDEQRCRLARCDLLGDHLNGGAMGVKTSDLGSEIHFVYFVNLFGEAHGGEFSVDLALRRLNVSITGHQWCLVESDHSCFLCTRIQLGVNLPGIGRLVEMQLERQMRASHEAFPEHAYAYRSKRCVVAPTAPVAQRPSELVGVLPTLAERNEEEEEEEEAEIAEAMNTATTASPELKLNQSRLVGAALLRWAMHRPRRHHALQDTVPVRVHRRHARVLLLCGCADAVAVDSNEIVE